MQDDPLFDVEPLLQLALHQVDLVSEGVDDLDHELDLFALEVELLEAVDEGDDEDVGLDFLLKSPHLGQKSLPRRAPGSGRGSGRPPG